MTKSEVSRQYRKKFGEKKPTLALARIMYNENNLLFNSVEDARVSLRRIEGKAGEKSRSKSVKESEFFKEGDRPKNPYNLPVSDETEFLPYTLMGHSRIALFSDIHVPYHNINAITCALDFCKKEKPDALLINGDGLDFHGLSKFNKDPRKKNFKQELDTWQSVIEIFEKVLKCKIYYKLGNHEERYENYLYQKAGELVGVEEFELANILKVRAKGIDVISDKRIIRANELNIIHGHEFSTGFFSPVNVARGLYLRGKTNAIQGHNHQTSSHTESDLNGRIVTTWSTGCMCELHPTYMPINKWNLGFAIVDLDSNKNDFLVRNKTIYRGRVL
jgi:predicted phosphodiesterase